MREEGKGYVSVAESSFVWKEGEGLGVKTFEGLTTCFEAGRSWTELDDHEWHLEPSQEQMDGIKGGADKVDLGRKGAPRKVGRSRISIANVEDVGSTKNHKRSHTFVRRISSHGCPYV